MAVLLLSVATDYTMLLVALSLLLATAAAVYWILKGRLGKRVNRPIQAVNQSSSHCLVGVTYRKTWQSKDLI